MTQQKNEDFLTRFAYSVKAFEKTMLHYIGWVVRETALEQFMEYGGGWLYDEGYISPENRELYRRMLTLFLEEDKVVKLVSYEDMTDEMRAKIG